MPSLPPRPSRHIQIPTVEILPSVLSQTRVSDSSRSDRQSGSNGGMDGDCNGDGDSGKEDDKVDGGGGNSNVDCDSGGGNDKDNGSDSAGGGHKQQSTKYREENVVVKATAAVRR
jgi:hypothetical protein